MIKRYKTKPCEIEAIQWTGENLEDIISFARKSVIYDILNPGFKIVDVHMEIKTLEGNMIVSEGDYIIKGLRGEFYPCKPDVFEKKYELIEE